MNVDFTAGSLLVPAAWGLGFVLFSALNVMFLVWMERKVSADIQSRWGPMVRGYHGSMQLLADMVKLLIKEDILPAAADKKMFALAPFLVFIPALLALLVLPIGPGLIARDMGVGLVYYLAVPSLASIGIFVAGWSSGNKYSTLGGMRSAAQLISYEIPRSLSVLGVVMLAGTLSMMGIVNAQKSLWFIIPQILGFLVYYIASIAEVGRTPFDLPEGESELVNGYFTEYSGMRFSFFMMGEYVALLVACLMGAVLFLGGWRGPFGLLPQLGPVWLLLKAYALVYVAMVVRWTLPRYRIDQLLEISWKVLLPISLINVALTAAIVFVGGEWLRGLLG
ncbi:MAG: NADH-quinone oxidoreductase subunit NuoH [Actinobacteria bacterium]|nr:NADH-quinone oxidoreductase subunit NuoH [Actinomycetota bacterium]